MWQKTNDNALVINTCSSAKGSWSRGLSPFILGPCKLYAGLESANMENAWQFSKVYKQHIDSYNNPTKEYFNWAKEGWRSYKAYRYPMGKGAIPEYSYWNGYKLGYIEARKRIYVPLYAEAVIKSTAYAILENFYKSNKYIILKDHDGYDYHKDGMSLTDVLNNPNRKMGHAFVLAMLLTNDEALKQTGRIE